MNKLICLLLLHLAVASSQAQYQIDAHLTGFPDGTVFYLKDIDADQVLDSAALQQGRIFFTGTFEDGPRGLWLYHSSPQQFYYCNLFMGNEKLLVQADKKDMPYNVRITGSCIQATETLLDLQTAPYNASRDSLVQLAMPLMMKGEQPSRQDSLWKLIRVIDDSVEHITQRFISGHINSYAGIRWLNYRKSKMDSSRIQSLLDQLRPEFRDHRYAQTVATFLRVGATLKKGDPSRDFIAHDSLGKPYQLSAYRGKYVLLNFSTTYCSPCMQSKEELKTADSTYRQELQLITFNADASRETWLKGVRRDHPAWPAVSDGKGPASETVMKYGATGYPTFVLLDPQGKIVQSWSGYGKGGILSVLQKQLTAQNKP
ncbi:TlpA disulfide reductase family protein [Paraflavitalea pollutisoli]|uniref:TlpA disulfide reductase family protein n=1 Tax=Paraflavitalea pollutisoli TaxID=3034143 RepID=UPI0023EBE212|nr:TlpA disulfide reductase family protein [Paraflavitalea sp. H1-2-19X]